MRSTLKETLQGDLYLDDLYLNDVCLCSTQASSRAPIALSWAATRRLIPVWLTSACLVLIGLISTSLLSHAAPTQLTQRLAVLELQGEVGTFARRQAWTDTMRATALKLLHDRGVQVIDRDQFTELVSPERDLSDCVGMCAAELAREVGAQWSLSGHLASAQAQVILFTLKLHDASGQLLGVEQREVTLTQLDRGQSGELARQLIEKMLIPQISSISRGTSLRRGRLEALSDRSSRVYTRARMRDRELRRDDDQERGRERSSQETQGAQKVQSDQPQAEQRWTYFTTSRGKSDLREPTRQAGALSSVCTRWSL